jgi:hypothetical protein
MERLLPLPGAVREVRGEGEVIGSRRSLIVKGVGLIEEEEEIRGARK